MGMMEHNPDLAVGDWNGHRCGVQTSIESYQCQESQQKGEEEEENEEVVVEVEVEIVVFHK